VEGENKYKMEKDWALNIKGEKYWNRNAFVNPEGEGEPEHTEEMIAASYDAKSK